MYCYHCGYEIDEHKIEMKQSSFEVVQDGDMSTSIAYVCPRCGHLIKENATEQDIKALTRACHAELQRSRNDVARGMSSLVFGAILLKSTSNTASAFSNRNGSVPMRSLNLYNNWYNIPIIIKEGK